MRNPETIVQLIDIEKKLWTNDPDFYHQALREDAMLVFGETGVITRTFAVDAIREEKSTGRVWDEVVLDEVQHLWITDDVVLLTYKSASRWKNEKKMIFALASSVYQHTAEGWKLIFHQQTPLPDNDKSTGDESLS